MRLACVVPKPDRVLRAGLVQSAQAAGANAHSAQMAVNHQADWLNIR